MSIVPRITGGTWGSSRALPTNYEPSGNLCHHQGLYAR